MASKTSVVSGVFASALLGRFNAFHFEIGFRIKFIDTFSIISCRHSHLSSGQKIVEFHSDRQTDRAPAEATQQESYRKPQSGPTSRRIQIASFVAIRGSD
jgi:hypothetical protein